MASTAMSRAKAASVVAFDEFAYLNAVLDEDAEQDARMHPHHVHSYHTNNNANSIPAKSGYTRGPPPPPSLRSQSKPKEAESAALCLATTANVSLTELAFPDTADYAIAECEVQGPYPVLRDGGSTRSLTGALSGEEDNDDDDYGDNDAGAYSLGAYSPLQPMRAAKNPQLSPSRTVSPRLATPRLNHHDETRAAPRDSQTADALHTNNTKRLPPQPPSAPRPSSAAKLAIPPLSPVALMDTTDITHAQAASSPMKRGGPSDGRIRRSTAAATKQPFFNRPVNSAPSDGCVVRASGLPEALLPAKPPLVTTATAPAGAELRKGAAAAATGGGPMGPPPPAKKSTPDPRATAAAVKHQPSPPPHGIESTVQREASRLLSPLRMSTTTSPMLPGMDSAAAPHVPQRRNLAATTQSRAATSTNASFNKMTSAPTAAAPPSRPSQAPRRQPSPSSSNSSIDVNTNNRRGKARYQRDTNLSLVLNSPLLPVAAATTTTTQETSDLNAHLSGTRKLPASAFAPPAVSSAASAPAHNTANLAVNKRNVPSSSQPPAPPPAVAKGEDPRHPVVVVVSPPSHATATQPADSPECERSLSQHSDSAESFDMWEYMNAEELAAMYGNNRDKNDVNPHTGSSSGSGDQRNNVTTAGAKEETHKASGVRAVPSELASMNWTAHASRRRNPTVSASRAASNVGPTSRSQQIYRSFPSLGFHGDYSFGAATRGSSVQSAAAAALAVTSATATAAGAADAPGATPAPAPTEKEAAEHQQRSNRSMHKGSHVAGVGPKSHVSSASTIGDMETNGSYVNFFNSFVRSEKSTGVGGPAAATEKSRAPVAPSAGLYQPRSNNTEENATTVRRKVVDAVRNDSSNTSEQRMSETEAAPAAGSAVIKTASKSSTQASSRFTSFGEHRPPQRHCLGSFFAFNDRALSPEMGVASERWDVDVDVDVESGGYIPLSARPPPYPSLFRHPRPLSEEQHDHSSDHDNVSYENTNSAAQASSTQYTAFPFLSTTASTVASDVQTQTNPLQRGPVQRPPQLAAITDTGDDEKEESIAVDGGYGYSSQLRLPMLTAPLSPQREMTRPSRSRSRSHENAASMAASVIPASKKAGDEDGSASLSVVQSTSAASPAFSPLMASYRPMSVVAQQYGSADWLRGEDPVMPKNDGVAPVTPASGEAQAPGAATSIERDDDDVSNNSISSQGYVYSSDDSTSEDAEVAAAAMQAGTTNELTDGNEGGEEEGGRPDDDEEQDAAEEDADNDALSRSLKAATSNPSPPRCFAARAGPSSPMMPSPAMLHGVRRDTYNKPSAPTAYMSSFYPNGHASSPPNLNGVRRYPPPYPFMWGGPSPQQQQRLDNISMGSSSSPNALHFNGRRGVMNGFALPQQPVQDPRMVSSSTTPQLGSGDFFHTDCSDDQVCSELPSLDAHDAGGLPGGLAIFQPSSPLKGQHPVAVPSLEESGVQTYTATSGLAAAFAEAVGLHPHPRPPNPPSFVQCLPPRLTADQAATNALSNMEPPSISRTHEWMQLPQSARSLNWAPPPIRTTSRPYVFAELEEARRHVGAKWYRFVALEIRWVPSPGLPPDERGLGEDNDEVQPAVDDATDLSPQCSDE
jgi:hypothetical protein